ncbi:MAG TPA: 4,5-dioxygenase [Rhodospirillaceae bacterium]|nr:4,5-dioxygenase [Rhodospirillaceae bacterium]HAA90978.1 4,5-dioxygenase [Rhodospirillaceae bacterium]HAT36401.1 4,5-dioxygenase [Rhodospirillaceae bacterium]
MAETGKIDSYHAHIYYDPEQTKDTAAEIREALAEKFPGAVIGNWHDELVGPHLVSMYQVKFDVPLFPEIVPWLSLNRQGLSILVHPQTGESKPDHTDYAMWMGERLATKFDLDEEKSSEKA